MKNGKNLEAVTHTHTHTTFTKRIKSLNRNYTLVDRSAVLFFDVVLKIINIKI